MIVIMMLMQEMKPKKIKMHLILWQWRRMKTTMDVQVLQMKMEEAFV